MARPLRVALLSVLSALTFACDPLALDDAGDANGPDAGRDAAGLDAAGLDAAGLDAPGADGGTPEGVALFVAQGHVGRSVVSCDDGRSWVGDTSMDDAAICWPEPDISVYDCDHHPGASKGLAYGRERFFGTLGWGPPGGIRRGDGAGWETVLEGTTFGDIVFGNDIVLAAAGNARRSVDGGETWSEPVDSQLTVGNVRRAGFWAHGDGVFVMVGEDGGVVDVVLSSDGVSFRHPTSIPASCGRGVQTDGGIVYGNGVGLILGGDGVACSSTDGGDTFTATELGSSVGSHVVFDGEAFIAFSGGDRVRSTDGVSWERAAISPRLEIGALARSPETGTLVAVRGGWQVWYERQQMYRSTDGGLTWETLGASAFTGGHPIRNIAFGHGVCPTP